MPQMKRELHKAKKDGYRIIYIDETMFTRKTVTKVEYCLPEHNMKADIASLDEPTLAVLSGTSLTFWKRTMPSP